MIRNRSSSFLTVVALELTSEELAIVVAQAFHRQAAQAQNDGDVDHQHRSGSQIRQQQHFIGRFNAVGPDNDENEDQSAMGAESKPSSAWALIFCEEKEPGSEEEEEAPW